MANPVLHFEIVGTDGEKTKRFFAELFGWSIDSSNPMNYGRVDPGTGAEGRGIAGGISGAMPGGSANVTFYVGVPDVEAAMAKAESLGGTRLFGPDTVTEGIEIAQFSDPEGNIIGLLKSPA